MGTRSDWYKVLSESGLVIQSAVLCESPSKVLLFSTVRLSINWFLNQFAMQKCFPFSFKRIIFTLCIAVVMLHSVVAFTPYFRFAARAKHGKVMNSASIMTDVTSKKSFVSTGSLDSAVIDKNLKLGVLFLNLGGPETIKDVEGFLYNLFADPDIIRLPSFLSIFQAPLAYVIAKQRAPKSSKAYESIGGGSPIVKYTREQSRLVQEALRRKGFEQANCYFAMRYWHPFTEEVLQQIQDDKVNTLVVVPLYPQFSVSTSGSSLKLLQDIFYKNPAQWGPDKIAHTVVPAWYHRPGYIKVMAKLILEQVVQYSEDDMREGLHVLFSAHGVPESYILGGDPYQKQITECVELVAKEISHQLASDSTRSKEVNAKLSDTVSKLLSGSASAGSGIASGKNEIKPIQFHLSFQSRVGPIQWLRPYTDDVIKQLGQEKKVRNLMVVPVSFVSEHIETLEEIDMEYRELAHECGITNWKRVPALNTDADFIEDMADLVVDALHAPTLTVAEAASKSYSDIMMEQSLGEEYLPSEGARKVNVGTAVANKDGSATKKSGLFQKLGLK